MPAVRQPESRPEAKPLWFFYWGDLYYTDIAFIYNAFQEHLGKPGWTIPNWDLDEITDLKDVEGDTLRELALYAPSGSHAIYSKIAFNAGSFFTLRCSDPDSIALVAYQKVVTRLRSRSRYRVFKAILLGVFLPLITVPLLLAATTDVKALYHASPLAPFGLVVLTMTPFVILGFRYLLCGKLYHKQDKPAPFFHKPDPKAIWAKVWEAIFVGIPVAAVFFILGRYSLNAANHEPQPPAVTAPESTPAGAEPKP